MKLGPVTNIDKENTTTLKKITMTSCRQIVTSLSFFQFMANLEQSRSRSIKGTYSLIVTFYFIKTENRQNSFNTAFTLLLWVKVLFLTKNVNFLQKNANNSEINRVLVLIKDIFYVTIYVFVLMYQVSSFYHNYERRG